MGTAFDGVDVVDVRMNVLRIVGVVHDGYLDGYALLLGLQVDDVVNKVGTMAVDVTYELLQTVLGMESLLARLAFFVLAEVNEVDGDAGIQVSQLAHAACDDVPLVGCSGENGGIGPELLACAGAIGIAYDLHIIERLTLFVLLLVDMTIAIDLRKHVFRQRIDAAYADAVQTSGHLIGAFVELTTCM